MPHDKVVTILGENMDTQFDGRVMQVMLDNIEDFQAIHKKYEE